MNWTVFNAWYLRHFGSSFTGELLESMTYQELGAAYEDLTVLNAQERLQGRKAYDGYIAQALERELME